MKPNRPLSLLDDVAVVTAVMSSGDAVELDSLVVDSAGVFERSLGTRNDRLQRLLRLRARVEAEKIHPLDFALPAWSLGRAHAALTPIAERTSLSPMARAVVDAALARHFTSGPGFGEWRSLSMAFEAHE